MPAPWPRSPSRTSPGTSWVPGGSCPARRPTMRRGPPAGVGELLPALRADRRAAQLTPAPGCGDRHAAWPADTRSPSGPGSLPSCCRSCPAARARQTSPGQAHHWLDDPSGTHNVPFGRGSNLPADYEVPAPIGGYTRCLQRSPGLPGAPCSLGREGRLWHASQDGHHG
jgi:hypothetical protein